MDNLKLNLKLLSTITGVMVVLMIAARLIGSKMENEPSVRLMLKRADSAKNIVNRFWVYTNDLEGMPIAPLLSFNQDSAQVSRDMKFTLFIIGGTNAPVQSDLEFGVYLQNNDTGEQLLLTNDSMVYPWFSRDNKVIIGIYNNSINNMELIKTDGVTKEVLYTFEEGYYDMISTSYNTDVFLTKSREGGSKVEVLDLREGEGTIYPTDIEAEQLGSVFLSYGGYYIIDQQGGKIRILDYRTGDDSYLDLEDSDRIVRIFPDFIVVRRFGQYYKVTFDNRRTEIILPPRVVNQSDQILHNNYDIYNPFYLFGEINGESINVQAYNLLTGELRETLVDADYLVTDIIKPD